MTVVWDVVVVGAGAAGLLAASRAAELGAKTLLLEKNRKPGAKILMSGGTRCNVTHDTDHRGILRAFGKQGKFLHSALAALSPKDVRALFAEEHVPTKVEATGKVFPESNKALDVQQALIRRCNRTGVELLTETPITSLTREDPGFVVRSEDQAWRTKSVLITTGGLSYPGCGTVGDGFRWANNFGHSVEPTRPALTPLKSPCDWARELSGLTISDVSIAVGENDSLAAVTDLHSTKRLKRALANDRGSFLFTHRGLSGPAPMNVSGALTNPEHQGPFWAVCDFLPDIGSEELRSKLDQEGKESGKRPLENLLIEWLPKRLVQQLIAEARLAPTHRLAELSKTQRNQVCIALKRQSIPLSGTMGYAKAEVTAGGVSRSEVHSSTLQSKLVEGLYFAGEVLDLDGPIGGYNFQSAFSTGWLAATKMVENVVRQESA